jgi:hypothetical protein
MYRRPWLAGTDVGVPHRQGRIASLKMTIVGQAQPSLAVPLAMPRRLLFPHQGVDSLRVRNLADVNYSPKDGAVLVRVIGGEIGRGFGEAAEDNNCIVCGGVADGFE